MLRDRGKCESACPAVPIQEIYLMQFSSQTPALLVVPIQVLLNSSPLSYTEGCTPVTATEVGQSVIPPGTSIPPDATPPAQVRP